MSLEKKNDLHWNMPGISQGGGDPRMSLGCEKEPASSIHLLSFISFFGIDFDTDFFFSFFFNHIYFVGLYTRIKQVQVQVQEEEERKKERKKEKKKKKEKKRMKLSRPAADPGHGSIPEVGPHLKGRDLGQRGSLAPGVQLNCRRRKKGYEFN